MNSHKSNEAKHMVHLTSFRTILGNLNATTSSYCILSVLLKFFMKSLSFFFFLIYRLGYLNITQKCNNCLWLIKPQKLVQKLPSTVGIGLTGSVVIMGFKCMRLF